MKKPIRHVKWWSMIILFEFRFSMVADTDRRSIELSSAFQPIPPSFQSSIDFDELEAQVIESQSLSDQIRNYQFQSLNLDKEYEVCRQRVVALLSKGDSASGWKPLVPADPDVLERRLDAMEEVDRRMFHLTFKKTWLK